MSEGDNLAEISIYFLFCVFEKVANASKDLGIVPKDQMSYKLFARDGKVPMVVVAGR
jgi:hypothetical protein